MTPFATLGIRRDVLHQLRRMARIEARPISTVVALAVADRLKSYEPTARAIVTSASVGEAK